MDLLKKAQEILKEEYICNNCLGRQYAKLLSGYSNKQRGKAIRLALLKHKGEFTQNDFKKFLKSKEKVEVIKEKCWVCDGLFERIDDIVKMIINETKNIEFDSFHVGIILNKELLKNEEKLWETIGTEYCEPIKSELNREIGKKIEQTTKKKVDLKNPNLIILINLERNDIELDIRPLFIYGKYKKFAKIPQTKWLCLPCKGLGCKRCNYKGKLYPTSVEEEIAKSLLIKSKGVTTKFHGAGREDRDARCLDWREFVIEVVEPRKRNIDLGKLEKRINKNKKIKVKSSRFSNKSKVKEIKSKRKNKTYKLVVEFGNKINRKDLKKLNKIKGIISQKTPIRSSRTQKLRKRKVFSIKSKYINSKKIELVIRGEAGLYIKELVTGDEGNTSPSLSELLSTKARVKSLDVIKIE